ncbi:MAG: Lrp/AsnC family transcriptional regulator [Bacteroidota bacterium]
MDEIDLKIISLLQENARIQNAELAREVGMAPSGVLERVRKLEKKGVIKSYKAEIDPAALELRLLAFILIRSIDKPGSCETTDALLALPEILELHEVAGEDCQLIKVRACDAKSLSDFMKEKLGQIGTITSTKTLIVLDTLKEDTKLVIDSNTNNTDE